MVRLDRGDHVPEWDQSAWSGIVSLGGDMGAYDVDTYPYLVQEKALLRHAIDAEKPLLGICLGSQLLADATGGRAFRAPRPEATVVRFGGGEVADPVVDQLNAPHLSFHEDTFEPPPAATLLYATDRYPQAFRIGSGIGIQTHPEVEPELVASWFSSSLGRDMLEEAGSDGPAILAELRSSLAESTAATRRFFDAWLDEVAHQA